MWGSGWEGMRGRDGQASGGEAVRLGRAVTQGVWADVCIARLTWFLGEATCPPVASPFCPQEPRARSGRSRGRRPSADPGGPRLGKERLLGRGCRRGRAGCVYENPANVNRTAPTPGAEGRAPQGRRMPGLLSSAPAEGEPSPARPAPPRGFLFSFFLARWCSSGRDSSAECRSRGEKGMGEGGGEKPEAHLALQPALGSQTTGQWLQLPRRHFLPEQPGSSVLCQPSLRAPCLLFSKQALWRSRDFSLDGDWARVPHMEAPLQEPPGVERVSFSPPQTLLQFRLCTDFEGAFFSFPLFPFSSSLPLLPPYSWSVFLPIANI